MYSSPMSLGTSLFLIALGAILKFAVTAELAGIELDTVGVILLIIGLVGLVIAVGLEISARSRGPREGAVREERVEYRDERPPR